MPDKKNKPSHPRVLMNAGMPQRLTSKFRVGATTRSPGVQPVTITLSKKGEQYIIKQGCCKLLGYITLKDGKWESSVRHPQVLKKIDQLNNGDPQQ